MSEYYMTKPNEAEIKRILEEADKARKSPPCLECGAMTQEEAETMCLCAGDKDDCHGCYLWPN